MTCPDPDLGQTGTASLVHDCTEQTARFYMRETHDPRYCFELFRRALSLCDEDAWRFIYEHYGTLVTGWIKRHPAFPTTGEEPGYFVNRAFEKMWSAVAPEFPFTKLTQVLRYLQMCVHSVILDHVRASEHATVTAQVEIPMALAAKQSSVESQVIGSIGASELWREINSRLTDDRERSVMYASFVLGQKPSQICAADPTRFPDVHQVYRIKENVLARLRRDAQLRSMFDRA